MVTENNLLPVPYSRQYSEETEVKLKRKFKKDVFLFFFAVYLVSTLLGAALVPGKLELDGISFSLSITANGASFLCVERCFFALFLIFAGFTPFRFPVSFTFSLFSGTYTGICIRLLLYCGNPLVSAVLAFLFAAQMLSDVFVSVSCFYVLRDNRTKRHIKTASLFVCVCIVYILVTYSLSLLVFLMLK